MRRRHKSGAPAEPETDRFKDGWQIVYTGFILIMLCFFVMLTSFASLDPSKITRFVNSFSNAVNVLDGGRSIEEGDTMLDDRLNVLPKEDLGAKLFEKVRQVSRENAIEQIELERHNGQVVLRLKNKLLFESSSAQLTPDAYDRLAKIGRLIKEIGTPVEIQGHTDDLPIRTDRFPSNWELSTARAITVLRYLSSGAGVSEQLLSAAGFAEFRPLVPNRSDADRARNRRVDLVFMVEEV